MQPLRLNLRLVTFALFRVTEEKQEQAHFWKSEDSLDNALF